MGLLRIVGLVGLVGLSAASVLRPPPPPPPTEGPGLGFLPAKVPQSRAGPSKAHRQLWGCSARVGDLVRGAGGCCPLRCLRWTRSPASNTSASPRPGANSQRSVQKPAPVTLVEDGKAPHFHSHHHQSGFQQKHLCPEFDTLQSNDNRSIRFKVQICFSNSSLYTGKLIGRLVFLEKKDTEGREGGEGSSFQPNFR